MTKYNLFSLQSFFSAIAWLYVFDVKPGFAYAVWILLIVTAWGLAYTYCKEDKKEDQNYH